MSPELSHIFRNPPGSLMPLLFRATLPAFLVVLIGCQGRPPAIVPTHPEPFTANTLLASADLRADLALLRRSYETLHPGLYRYNTPARIAEAFDEVDRYFSEDRSVADAFLALTRLTAGIRCGHSYPNFWNQPDQIDAALFQGRDKLPFEFRWLGGRMIVVADHTPGGDLPRGTEVLSIDGIPTGTILETLLPLARADGSNDAKRVAYLEVRGRARYHAFDILYPLVYPVRDTVFTLSVIRPGETDALALEASAMDLDQRRMQGSADPEPGEADPLWSYEESDEIGVLSMPTWALFNSKWDARGWTDSLLQDLAGRAVPDLVIDLRGNEGGVDAGNELLARLIDEPIELPVYVRHVRYREVPEDLVPFLDTWDDSFYDRGRAAKGPVDSLFYRLERREDESPSIIRPAAPRFRGRVWVLVGADNSSATFQFALAVKRSGVATLVGQPTGGNRRGINGDSFFFLRLPKTGFEVDLPLVAGFPLTDEPDAGVEPDILVTPTAADVVNGTDPEMEAVRSRILELRAR